jgi:hypothetical protein
MQHVAEQTAHLFARAAISNFEPFTLFVLAKMTTCLTNHGNYIEDEGRFFSLPVSLRVSPHRHANEFTEATVFLVVAGFALTTNDREVEWLLKRSGFLPAEVAGEWRVDEDRYGLVVVIGAVAMVSIASVVRSGAAVSEK